MSRPGSFTPHSAICNAPMRGVPPQALPIKPCTGRPFPDRVLHRRLPRPLIFQGAKAGRVFRPRGMRRPMRTDRRAHAA